MPAATRGLKTVESEVGGNRAPSLRIAVSSEAATCEERGVFDAALDDLGVDHSVWEVFDRLMGLSARGTMPQAVRAYAGEELAGLAFVIRCRAYGRAVFDTPVFRAPIDLVGLPSFIWIRAGMCAEAAANPGFVARGHDQRAVLAAMLRHLKSTSCGVVVIDTPENAWLHEGGQVYPYVADGVLDLGGFGSVEEFVASHGNVDRKLKEYARKGGCMEVTRGRVPEVMLSRFQACMESTVNRSIVYSPFQGLFPGIVAETCRIDRPEMIHFVTRLKGEVMGYHTFVRAGQGLRMVHGAFDRTLPTTHHAYESLIVRVAEYAIEHGLTRAHFGPVMNETKRRMMNVSHPCALYFHTQYALVQLLFPPIFRRTKMQSAALLAFCGAETSCSQGSSAHLARGAR